MKRRNFSIILGMILILVLTACSQTDGNTASSGGDISQQVSAGKLIFQANCTACHATESDQTLVGPSMVHLVGRSGDKVGGLSAEEYIRQSILEPGAYINEGFPNLMPDTYGHALSAEEMDALIAYLMTFD